MRRHTPTTTAGPLQWIRIHTRRVPVALLLLLAALTGLGCPDSAMRLASEPGSRTNGRLVIKGSDTLVELVAIWAEMYGEQHPNAKIVITGGGTGTGFAAMFNGTTDLIMASRAAKGEEKQRAQRRGSTLHEIVCARDALAVVVNEKNPVASLTMGQLKDIYTGKVTNWKDVGGADAAIVPFSRESGSGTYVFFEEYVLKKQKYAQLVRPQGSNVAITGSVKDTPGGIGYVGLAHIHDPGVRAVPIQADPEKPAVFPSVETALDNRYPISRPLFLYSDGPPKKGSLLEDFVKFATSDAGQKLAIEAGYVPIKKPIASISARGVEH